MEFENWKNPYIDLIETRPDLILSCKDEKVSDDEQRTIRNRVASANKVYCELGSGSGNHLIGQAEKNPDGLFIGFEIRFKRVFRTAEKAQKLGLNNLMVVRTKAQSLPNLVPPASLDGVYINFPDPWAKLKWRKHRLISPTYLEQLATLLKPQGFLSYKTDHAEYFDATLELFKTLPQYKERRFSRDLHKSEFAADNVESEFERLFKYQGLPTFFLEMERIGA